MHHTGVKFNIKKMTIVIALFITALIIATVYICWEQHNMKQEGVYKVEAGPISGVEIGTHNQKSATLFTLWDEFETKKKEKIDRSNYNVVEVDGGCMDPIKIEKGDFLLYEILHAGKTILLPEDLIVLEIDDPIKGKIRKIRLINQVVNQTQFETYYFKKVDDKWCKKKSSVDHTVEQILGVVRYKIADRAQHHALS